MAGDDMDQLLKALRETAQAEDRADEAALAEAGPAALLDDASRMRITAAIVEAPTGVVSLEGRRKARQRWVVFAAAPLAVAAAALLVIFPRPPATAPLPEYAMVATGGLRDERAALVVPRPDELQRLGPHSVLDVKLRPATAVEGTVVAMAFAVQGEQADPVPATIVVSASGAVSVRAEAATVFGNRRGRWDLRVLLARPPLALKLRGMAVGARGSGTGWQRLTVPLELLP